MARIILIDDETRLLQTLTRFLEQQGHTVKAGPNFRAVERDLQPGGFEVLITDIVMPDFDGMHVLREVVEVRGCQEPVILITGEPNLETASEAVRRGAFDYISKPVTKDKLLEAVMRGLRHVNLLRERDRSRHTEMQVLQNLARLGESASVLSHEIRTPITSLRHALRAVGEKLGVEDRVLLEEFAANLNRIERMLGQTLAFAKPMDLQCEPTEVTPWLQEVVQHTRRLPMVDTSSIETSVQDGLAATFDRQFLGEVVTNLLRNAAEACSGKGHIEVRATADRSRMTIDVADDGPGVPIDKREEIFKPFHSSKDYGTGIGLAFCRKVVESHGGSISFVEQPAGGACFRVVLPLSVDTPGADRAVSC